MSAKSPNKSHKHLILFAVGLMLILHSANWSAVAVALKAIVTDLDTSLVLAGWVLNGYQLMALIMMPLADKLCQKLGRKRMFVASVSIFTLGSALSAVSPNIALLAASRIIQAIGGGGSLPCAMAILSHEFPEARQRYIGLFTSFSSIGALLGSNMGGLLVQTFQWRSVFWFNLLPGILIVVLSQLLLHPSEKQRASFDFIGIGLLSSFLAALLLGLTALSNPAYGTSLFMGAMAVGVTSMVLFIRRAWRVKEPIIHLALLKQRPFLAANAYSFVYGVFANGLASLLPLYAVSAYTMSTLESGVIMTPRSMAYLATSTVVSFCLAKWGYRWPLLVGTLAMAFTLATLSLQPQGIEVIGFHISPALFLITILGLSGAAHGVIMPPSNSACIELMPEKVAAITGLRMMFGQLGSTLGFTIATLVLYSIGEMQRAFFVVLLSASLGLLVAIPLIFMIPDSLKGGAD